MPWVQAKTVSQHWTEPVNVTAKGRKRESIALDIEAELSRRGVSGRISVIVEGLPAGAALSAGTNNWDKTWSLAAGDLSGLKFHLPEDRRADYVLAVRVLRFDDEGFDVANTVAFFDMTVPAAPTGPGTTDAERIAQERLAAATVEWEAAAETSLAAAKKQAEDDAADRVRRARLEWKTAESERIAVAQASWADAEARQLSALEASWQAEARARLSASMAAWRAAAGQRLAADKVAWREEEERRLAAEKAAWDKQADTRIAAAKSAWQAALEQKLTEAKAHWRTEEEKRLAEARMAAGREGRRRDAAAPPVAVTNVEDALAAARSVWEADTEQRLKEAELRWRADVERRVSEIRTAFEDDSRERLSLAEKRWTAAAAARLAAARDAWQSAAQTQPLPPAAPAPGARVVPDQRKAVSDADWLAAAGAAPKAQPDPEWVKEARARRATTDAKMEIEAAKEDTQARRKQAKIQVWRQTEERHRKTTAQVKKRMSGSRSGRWRAVAVVVGVGLATAGIVQMVRTGGNPRALFDRMTEANRAPGRDLLYVRAASAVVRAEAASDSAAVDSLPQDTPLREVRRRGNWVQIALPGSDEPLGWMPASLLRTEIAATR